MHYNGRMKSVCLTIRDCPAEVHRALSERAAAHKRSLNSETIVVLKNALDAPRMGESEFGSMPGIAPFRREEIDRFE